jgi:hypothetical protein
MWIHTYDLWIRIREAQKHADPADPDPQHCFFFYHLNIHGQYYGLLFNSTGDDSSATPPIPPCFKRCRAQSTYCSNVEKLLKYDRKQLILSHMYSLSEIFLNVVVVR